jgi:hypothetical protein
MPHRSCGAPFHLRVQNSLIRPHLLLIQTLLDHYKPFKSAVRQGFVSMQGPEKNLLLSSSLLIDKWAGQLQVRCPISFRWEWIARLALNLTSWRAFHR